MLITLIKSSLSFFLLNKFRPKLLYSTMAFFLVNLLYAAVSTNLYSIGWQKPANIYLFLWTLEVLFTYFKPAHLFYDACSCLQHQKKKRCERPSKFHSKLLLTSIQKIIWIQRNSSTRLLTLYFGPKYRLHILLFLYHSCSSKCLPDRAVRFNTQCNGSYFRSFVGTVSLPTIH